MGISEKSEHFNSLKPLLLELCKNNGTSTNVGRHKRQTVQMSDAQASDQYKRRTSTIVGPVQTSD